jgi:hypothetical protein
VNAVITTIEQRLGASGIVVLSDLVPGLRMLYPDVFARVIIDDDDDSDSDVGGGGDGVSGTRRVSVDSSSVDNPREFLFVGKVTMHRSVIVKFC